MFCGLSYTLSCHLEEDALVSSGLNGVKTAFLGGFQTYSAQDRPEKDPSTGFIISYRQPIVLLCDYYYTIV